ncbi:putative two pore calcium channel protein 1 isoform X3 [Apostichopus japonicus]|uniref:Putative two pore calcium channel protein 1 isoform X3 n=1 Tax=Stichopus japonicus TaxID=307972 RepID=A0A2G8KUV6_STIJA|nr:putative two pore calcium channel protein 1 isoform X3 [Apostichopus japonicus]
MDKEEEEETPKDGDEAKDREDESMEETGKDSHVAAYRDFIIQMEREIATSPEEQSPNRPLVQVTEEGVSIRDGPSVPSFNFQDGPSEKDPTPPGRDDSPETKSNNSSGRNSPFKNRVEPLVEDVEKNTNSDRAEELSSTNLSEMFVSSRRPLITSEFVPEYERNGLKTNSPDSGVEHDLDCNGIDRPISKPSLGVGSKRKISDKNYTRRIFVRTFKERASQENFALYGLLTPALCLVPSIDGNDSLTESFTELKGEDRELKLAAAHVDDAITGRGKYGRARAFFKPSYGRWSFNILVSQWFHYLVLTVATVHIALTFVEPPPNPESTSLVPIIVTPLCLLVYIADIAVHVGFLSWKVFWQWNENKWQRVEFVFVIVFTLDYIMLVIQWILGMRLLQPFRCLRAAIILVKLKNVQHVYGVVMSIVIKLGKVFLIIIIFILMFSAVGVNIFMSFYHCIGQNTTQTNCTESPNEIYTGSFDNVAITFLRLFVLLSTENYPEVMIPAYSQSKVTFIYFGIFFFVGVFFLTAILLAIVVDSYWEFAKKHVKEERSRERAELAKAWNLLDPLGKGSLPITDERFLKLFKILKPSNTEEMNMQLINYLDSNNDGQIDSAWNGPSGSTRLSALISRWKTQEPIFNPHVLISLPQQCGPKWMKAVGSFAQKIVRSDVFSKCSFLFAVAWILMLVSLGIQIAKTVILVVFMVEIVLSVFGECLNLLHIIEVLDIVLILVAMAANIAWYLCPDEFRGVCNVISGLAVAFRVGFNSLQTKKTVIMFFTKIFPVMSDLIILILIIGYFYAVLGWESFSHIKPNLSYEADHYNYECGLGFDTFALCYQPVLGHVSTFDLFSVINMVVMNLFVAIAIEAFNKLGKEKELETGIQKQKTKNNQKSLLFFFHCCTLGNNLFTLQSMTMQHVPLPGLVFDDLPPHRLAPISAHPHSLQKQEKVEEEDEPEEDEDLSHLTPQERKKKMMKKKLERKRRKKKALQTIVVTTAFRASKDQEISLNVGEQVEILQKQEEWWEGQIAGRRGWFPSSHVKEVKKSTQPVKTRHMSLDREGRPAWENSQTGLDRSQSVVQKPTYDKTPSTDTLNTSLGSTGGRSSKPKLKLRSSGNWRKEILGDITVINPQELKELNKILKAQHSISSTSKLKSSGSLRKSPSISESIEEEPEPEVSLPVPPKTQSSPRPKMLPPKISFDRAPTLPLLEEEEEEEEDAKQPPPDKHYDADREDTLTVEQPSLPPELKKKRNKEQNKSGEMPSWMAKFVETNNLSITTDVKFDDDGKQTQDEQKQDEDGTIESIKSQSIPGIVIEEDTPV